MELGNGRNKYKPSPVLPEKVAEPHCLKNQPIETRNYSRVKYILEKKIIDPKFNSMIFEI